MDQDDSLLEEGELSNDSGDGQYTPLERPLNYSISQPNPRLPAAPVSESEEEEVQSNDSDSDSDCNSRRIKKPKIKLKPRPQQRNFNYKTKKYDIWSSKVQEDTLAATLVNCDVDKKDRSRSVESYDYTIARKYYNNEYDNRFSKSDNKTNKRTRDNRNNPFFNRRQRSPSADNNVKGEPRKIEDLTVDVNDEPEEIAKDIASKLKEEKTELIVNVITVLGKEKAIRKFKETQEIEADGGMLIMNKTRRRTPGGVFLNLVRNDYHITFDQRNQIFGQERSKLKQAVKQKRKDKAKQIQKKVAVDREKILPDLLTRAELLAAQNPNRKVKESGEQEDCVNPPPTPETDGCENSRDGMEGSPLPIVNGNDSLDSVRGKLEQYEDDFLDLGCGDDMDLF